LSMLDTVIAFLWGSDMGAHTFVGDELPAETAQSFIDLVYQTSDGHISVAVQSDKEWNSLTRALEKPEWLNDPRFASAALRQKNIDERLKLTQEALLLRSTDDWLERLEAEDVPCAPVLTRREVIKHPQVVANDTVVELEHPIAGKVRQTRQAPRFSKTAQTVRHQAPQLGENSVAILTEAGFSTDEIDALVAAQVTTNADSSGNI